MSETASTLQVDVPSTLEVLGEALDSFTPRRTPESQFSMEKFMLSRAASEEKFLKGLVSKMRTAVRSHDMVRGNAAVLSLFSAMRQSFARIADDNQSASALAISARSLKSVAEELKDEKNHVVNERLQEDLRNICDDVTLAAEMAEQQKDIQRQNRENMYGGMNPAMA